MAGVEVRRRVDGRPYVRTHSYELKRKAVQLYLEEGLTVGVSRPVSWAFGRGTVFDWVRQYREQGEAGLRPKSHSAAHGQQPADGGAGEDHGAQAGGSAAGGEADLADPAAVLLPQGQPGDGAPAPEDDGADGAAKPKARKQAASRRRAGSSAPRRTRCGRATSRTSRSWARRPTSSGSSMTTPASSRAWACTAANRAPTWWRPTARPWRTTARRRRCSPTTGGSTPAGGARRSSRRRLEKDHVHHIRSAPHHPMTLGKIERFWQTLKDEFLKRARFETFEEARERIGYWVKYYNHKRPHQGLEGMCPADRFFSIQKELRAAIERGVAANVEELALRGKPVEPFYLVGRMGEQSVVIETDKKRMSVRVDGQALPAGQPLVYELNEGADHEAGSQQRERNREAASREHSAKEKAQAVLALWSGRRSPSALSKELEVPWAVINTWEKRALSGMLTALDPNWKQAGGGAAEPAAAGGAADRADLEAGRGANRRRRTEGATSHEDSGAGSVRSGGEVPGGAGGVDGTQAGLGAVPGAGRERRRCFRSGRTGRCRVCWRLWSRGERGRVWKVRRCRCWSSGCWTARRGRGSWRRWAAASSWRPRPQRSKVPPSPASSPAAS